MANSDTAMRLPLKATWSSTRRTMMRGSGRMRAVLRGQKTPATRCKYRTTDPLGVVARKPGCGSDRLAALIKTADSAHAQQTQYQVPPSYCEDGIVGAQLASVRRGTARAWQLDHVGHA